MASGVAHRWALCALLVVLAVHAVVGCQGFGKPTVEEASRQVQRVQLAVQNFADEYALRVKQAADGMYPELETARERQKLSRRVLAVSTACASIPSGPNPSVNIVDMIVMTTLNYEVGRRTIPRDFGEAGGPLLSAYEWGHDRAWEAARERLSEEYVTELRGLIDEWKERNPEVEFVTLVRFEDFLQLATRERRTRASGGKNIFSLLLLDPFAGLEPSTREIRETRLFAERALFFGQRLPGLVSLEFQHMIDSLAASPTGQGLARVMEQATESSERLVAVSESLPETLERERTAALEQAADLLERERSAAIEQMGAEFESRTERLIERVGSEQAGMRETMLEVRATVESATELSESLRTTIAAAEGMRGPRAESGGERESLDLEQLNATIASAQATVGELNKLVESLRGVLESDQWGAREDGYRMVLADTEEAGARIVDRAFNRLLWLVGALTGGLVVVVLVAKMVGRRGV